MEIRACRACKHCKETIDRTTLFAPREFVCAHPQLYNRITGAPEYWKVATLRDIKDTHRCGYEGKWFEPKENK
jgi:hypothetical protein